MYRRWKLIAATFQKNPQGEQVNAPEWNGRRGILAAYDLGNVNSRQILDLASITRPLPSQLFCRYCDGMAANCINNREHFSNGAFSVSQISGESLW
jgi:hypothetical protein